MKNEFLSMPQAVEYTWIGIITLRKLMKKHNVPTILVSKTEEVKSWMHAWKCREYRRVKKCDIDKYLKCK